MPRGNYLSFSGMGLNVLNAALSKARFAIAAALRRFFTRTMLFLFQKRRIFVTKYQTACLSVVNATGSHIMENRVNCWKSLRAIQPQRSR
jgi:hypothetical protein